MGNERDDHLHEADGEFYAGLLRAYINSANDAIFVLCNELKFLSCNARMENWMGIEESELTRHNCRRPITDLVGNPETTAALEHAAERALAGESQRFECMLEPTGGEKRWVEISMTRVDVEAGEMVIAVARDTTERRAQMEKIRHQATHDALTGLPNRRSLRELLEAHVETDGALVALAVDVPRFRDLNEALGHQCADEILKYISSGLGSLADSRQGVHVFRVAGDRFVMVIQGASTRDWKAISESVQKWFATPLQQSGIELTLGSKIGVSQYPSHVSDPKDLVRSAEVALHVAKQDAVADIKIYYPELQTPGRERLALLNDLRQAIADEAIEVYFQPIVPLHGQGLVRLETLARWHHPDRGMVAPDQFIALAESSGQIVALTWLVIAQALEHAAPLVQQNRIESVSINLSPYCLLDGGFTLKFSALLSRYDIPPSSVVLEITESIAMSESMQRYSVMSLRELGVELSIDDFGTGHSSLSKLRQLPVTELKIDRTFVTTMLGNDDDEAIVVATILLAQTLGLDVVAEGIEDVNVLRRLGELGCDYAQGYYICHPLPPGKLLVWLDSKQVLNHGA